MKEYTIADFEDRIKKFNYIKALEDICKNEVCNKGKIYKMLENVMSDQEDQEDDPTLRMIGENGNNHVLFSEFKKKDFIFVTDKYVEKHKEDLFGYVKESPFSRDDIPF